MVEFGLDFEVFLLLAIGETPPMVGTVVKPLLSGPMTVLVLLTFPSGLAVLLLVLLFETGSCRVDTMLEFHNEGPPIE